MPQQREEGVEPPLVTSGDDLVNLPAIFGNGKRVYAEDVIDYLLGTANAATSAPSCR